MLEGSLVVLGVGLGMSRVGVLLIFPLRKGPLHFPQTLATPLNNLIIQSPPSPEIAASSLLACSYFSFGVCVAGAEPLPNIFPKGGELMAYLASSFGSPLWLCPCISSWLLDGPRSV